MNLYYSLGLPERRVHEHHFDAPAQAVLLLGQLRRVREDEGGAARAPGEAVQVPAGQAGSPQGLRSPLRSRYATLHHHITQ